MTRPIARAFVTGGAGFIGARLSAALSAAGTEVTVFDSFLPQVHDGNPGNRAILEGTGARVVRGDLRDAEALASALVAARPDTVFHLGAETGTGQSFDEPVRYTGVNVQGTAHLIAAIRAAGGVGRVILAGSRAVYGEGACVDAEGRPAAAVARRAEDLAAGEYSPKDARGRKLRPVPTAAAGCAPDPASIYASGKLMQEYLLAQAFWGSGTEVGRLRLQNVYGAGQSLNNPYTGVLSIFLRQIAEGRVLEIYEDGEITRDFVEVRDVVAAFLAMARAPALPPGPVDIGTGQGVTILAAARLLMALMGVPPDQAAARLRISGAFRPGDIRHAVAETTLAREALGWSAALGLEEGLRHLIAMAKGSDR